MAIAMVSSANQPSPSTWCVLRRRADTGAFTSGHSAAQNAVPEGVKNQKYIKECFVNNEYRYP